MLEYYYNTFSPCSSIEFNKQIEKAKSQLLEQNPHTNTVFELNRQSPDIAYTINSTEYQGEYHIYAMRSEELIIGHLNCFYSLNKDFIEIDFVNA